MGRQRKMTPHTSTKDSERVVQWLRHLSFSSDNLRSKAGWVVLQKMFGGFASTPCKSHSNWCSHNLPRSLGNKINMLIVHNGDKKFNLWWDYHNFLSLSKTPKLSPRFFSLPDESVLLGFPSNWGVIGHTGSVGDYRVWKYAHPWESPQ